MTIVIYLLTNESELLEIRTKVTTYKEQIKNSAQKILTALDTPNTDTSINSEKLEILTALGNIGTISGTSENIAGYSNALAEAFSFIQSRENKRENEIAKGFYQIILNQLCSTPFDVKQKGKKFEITIPSINLDSVFKFVGLDNRK